MDSVKDRITVKISFWAVAAFGAAACIDRAAVFILFCALVHEFGHLFACMLLNVHIEEFNLTVMGIGITKSSVSSRREIAITAAGPLAGLIFTAVAYISGYHSVGSISLILSVINLLPIPPLDGDRILREIFPSPAILFINIITILFLFGFGLYFAIKHISFTLLLFSLLMICCFFGKYPQTISAKMFRNSNHKF